MAEGSFIETPEEEAHEDGDVEEAEELEEEVDELVEIKDCLETLAKSIVSLIHTKWYDRN